MQETVGGTHRNDGIADGGEPYTDEEMAIMDREERRVAAFFEDLAKTRERFDWQMRGLYEEYNRCAPIRAVPKGMRLGDHNLPCDCPIVAVAKLRATAVMGGTPTRFHLSNGSRAVEMARAVDLPTAFITEVINAPDGNVNVDADGNEVPIYSQELRDRLLKAVGIIEA